MSIIFLDGADHYATAEIGRKWDYVSGAAISGINQRRSASSHLRIDCAATPGQIHKILPVMNTWAYGFALKVEELDGGHRGFELVNNLTAQAALTIELDGSIALRRGGYTGTIIDQSDPDVILADQWQWLEAKIFIDDSAGTYRVDVSGSTVLSGSSVDTKGGSVVGADRIRLRGFSKTSATYLRIDDLYIGSDAVWADSRVDICWPTSAGLYAQWTPNGEASNHLCVDEPNDMDDDTTYVETDVLDEIDTHHFGDLIPLIGATIRAVGNTIAVRKVLSDIQHLTPMSRRASTDYPGTEVAIPLTTYSVLQSILETDPSTAAAWTESGFNAAQWGYKLTTEETTARVTQIITEVLRDNAEVDTSSKGSVVLIAS